MNDASGDKSPAGPHALHSGVHAIGNPPNCSLSTVFILPTFTETRYANC